MSWVRVGREAARSDEERESSRRERGKGVGTRRIVIGERGVTARLRARVDGWLGRAEKDQQGAVAAAHKAVRESGPSSSSSESHDISCVIVIVVCMRFLREATEVAAPSSIRP